MLRTAEKSEPSDTAGGNVKWCSHFEKQSASFSKQLNIELPNDPAILLLGKYPKSKTCSNKSMYRSVYSSIIYSSQKGWKLSKYSSADERINKIIIMYISIAAVFIIAQTWKRSSYPSVTEWINKVWYIHTVEY